MSCTISRQSRRQNSRFLILKFRVVSRRSSTETSKEESSFKKKLHKKKNAFSREGKSHGCSAWGNVRCLPDRSLTAPSVYLSAHRSTGARCPAHKSRVPVLPARPRTALPQAYPRALANHQRLPSQVLRFRQLEFRHPMNTGIGLHACSP